MSGSRHFEKAAHFFSREQFRAGRREGHERPGFMHLEPAALDREFEARAVLGRAAAVTEQKRLVDFLDVDAVLNGLDRVGDFEDAARGLLWIGKGARGSVFHQVPILAGA
jgi:hypothetical protein